MKKNILTLTALTLLAGSVVFTSCKKDDITNPEVTIIGTDMTLSLQGTYTEPGATAEDNKDGKLTPTTSGSVNTNLAGVYEITYTATDAAGNSGTAVRKVTVKNDADAAWSGNYDGNETDALGPYTYSGNTDPSKVVKISASTTVNNQIWINRLGDFANNMVKMTITGTTIDIPAQTVPSVGTGTATCDVHNRSTNGTGTKTSTGFTLVYSDSKVSPCSGNRAAVNATFTKK